MFEIFFLGTGSAAPSLIRRHSSFAVRKDGEILLFDCGESCQHQMIRANLSFNKIHSIFISHLHGDHIYGLPGLLSTMFLNRRDFPIAIYGPKGIRRFIESTQPPECHVNKSLNIIEYSNGDEYSLLRSFTLGVHLLNHSIKTYGFRMEEKDRPGLFYPEKAKELAIPEGPLYGRLQRGQTIIHNNRTIEPSMVMGPDRKGIKFGYVADTSFCPNCLKIAKKADVLVYEGTYLEKDRDKAEKYMHSTVLDAGRTAAQAGAKLLYITHIGTKYTGSELREELKNTRKIFKNSYIARDLLRVEIKYDKP